MSDYLPQELLTQILAGLPVKSILQFRCVSKKWYSLISSPFFISCHLSAAAIDHLHLSASHGVPFTSPELFYLTPHDQLPLIGTHQVCPFGCLTHDHGGFELVGTCNGVLGLTHLPDFADLLWNPSVRKCVRLPQSKFASDWPPVRLLILGLGFDSSTDDYKFVKGVRYEIGDVVEVYSVKRRSWRELNLPLPFDATDLQIHSVFANGACNWLVRSSRGKPGPFILSFDVGEEQFGEVPIPEALMDQKAVGSSTLLSSNGSLCLALLLLTPELKWSVDFWLMKEYGEAKSWTKLFSMEDFDFGDNIVRLMKNGDVQIRRYGGRLVYYNPTTKEERDCEKVKGIYSSCLDDYKESLVLLNEGDGRGGTLEPEEEQLETGSRKRKNWRGE